MCFVLQYSWKKKGGEAVVMYLIGHWCGHFLNLETIWSHDKENHELIFEPQADHKMCEHGYLPPPA